LRWAGFGDALHIDDFTVVAAFTIDQGTRIGITRRAHAETLAAWSEAIGASPQIATVALRAVLVGSAAIRHADHIACRILFTVFTRRAVKLVFACGHWINAGPVAGRAIVRSARCTTAVIATAGITSCVRTDVVAAHLACRAVIISVAGVVRDALGPAVFNAAGVTLGAVDQSAGVLYTDATARLANVLRAW